MASETKHDLLPAGATHLLAVLGTLLGIASPLLGLPAVATSSALGIVNEVRERQQKRRVRRLERIVANLSARIADLEQTPVGDEVVDLFLEVVRKAVDDDEDSKTTYYVGLLEWIRRDSPSHAQVRVLSDAVRQLAAVELEFFLRECAGHSARVLVDKELSEHVVLARLESSGLCTGGVRHRGNPTRLGKVLVRYVDYRQL